MSVLLTGATGFLGMEVLVRLLDQPGVEIIALVRARDRQAATARIDTVLGQLYEHPVAPALARRITALPGDVSAPELGLSAEDRRTVTQRTTSIVHCAASISFDLPLEEAREINTAGTRRLLALAGDVADLRRLVHVSTAYVGGRHNGTFGEDDLDVGQEFRNSYEQSKFEAEAEVMASGLPLVIARPSIVVGDRFSGWTPAFNVIYWPLRAFARGMLDEVPANPDGVVDVVPVDYVADALVHLLGSPEATGAINLVAGRQAVTNAQLIELACRALGRTPPRINNDAAMIEEASAYLPYFDVSTRFDDRRARSLLEPVGIATDDFDAYFPAIIDYAQRARWGKTPLTREGAQLARVRAA
jgi:thioester reductase-like protein